MWNRVNHTDFECDLFFDEKMRPLLGMMIHDDAELRVPSLIVVSELFKRMDAQIGSSALLNCFETSPAATFRRPERDE
jgi:hypothetical protein